MLAEVSLYKVTLAAVRHSRVQFSLSSRHTPQICHIKATSKQMQLKKEVISETSISKSFVWDTSQKRNCNNDNKEFLSTTHTVEHNYISPSSTVGIQLHVSALYVGHLQVAI